MDAAQRGVALKALERLDLRLERSPSRHGIGELEDPVLFLIKVELGLAKRKGDAIGAHALPVPRE